MNKKLITFISVPVLLAGVAWAAGVTPAYVINAPEVATGIGARLACSMRYVQQHEQPQIIADIKVYSPLLVFLDYHYDPETQSVTAALGPYQRSASFIEGVGCDLDYAGYERTQYALPNISIDSEAPWPLGNQVDTLQPHLQSKLQALLEEDNQLGEDTRALLLVHQGKIVAEAYAEGYHSDSIFLGWSMSKSVTGLLAGQLALEGKLDVDESHLFSEWQDGRQHITIRQLMNMTDGLDYEELYEPGGTAPAMLFQTPDSAEFMKQRNLITPVGEHYRYSSGSTNLVMDIVMQRTAETRAHAIQIITQKFLQPLAFSPVVFEVDGAGLLMGSSYMYSTARNWAKLGQLMLNGGEINGTRLVSEQWVRDSVQYNQAKNRDDYGYFWWLNSRENYARWPSLPENTYSSMGSRDQRVTVIPDQELVIVRLGWSDGKYRDDENFANILTWFE